MITVSPALRPRPLERRILGLHDTNVLGRTIGELELGAAGGDLPAIAGNAMNGEHRQHERAV
jgi:hypothetical protein